jgi:DNA-binding transcriptional regulator YiaG
MLRVASRLTTPSSATAEHGAAAAWWRKGGGRKQPPCALLGICDRKLQAPIPAFSPYRRLSKGAAAEPKTLGENLRRKRMDRGLTHMQVAAMLGVTYQTVERWEHNRNPISVKNQEKILAFLGNNPSTKTHDPSI